MKSTFEAVCPNITRWVKERGTVEIGYDFNTDSFIRAIDEGGMVWSGKSRYENLDAVFQDLEAGLGQILVERVLGSSFCEEQDSQQDDPIRRKPQPRRRKAPPEALSSSKSASSMRSLKQSEARRTSRSPG